MDALGVEYEPYHRAAHRLRQEVISKALDGWRFRAVARRKARLFGLALAVAAGTFWSTMLTAPPTSAALEGSENHVFEINSRAPLELPALDVDTI
jgi:hypothetical protein